MITGIFYVLLSIAAVAFWRTELSLCAADICLTLPGLLGHSWYLWGALFYTIAGFLCLSFPKNRATGAFLAAGAVFHAGLIGYGYATTGVICPACWKFAVMGALLAAAYWFLPGRRIKWAAGVPAVLALIALVLLVNNPSTAPEKLDGSPLQIAQASTIQNSDSNPFLQVLAPTGEEVILDISRKPALFFAVWCSHCDAALREAAKKGPNERPYLVVTYLRDGDTEKVKDKLAQNGLAGEEYYLVERPPASVKSVPVLIGRGGV